MMERPDELPQMPDFVTQHIDPFTGEDDTADIDAGTGTVLSRAAAAARHPARRHGGRGGDDVDDDRGAGEPQRALPLRLGPQVQALPRGGASPPFC